MSFPTSLPSYTTPTSSETLAAAGHTNLHITEEADILGIATKIGTGASTPTSSTLLRGNGIGTSTWDTIHLSSDVQGVLGTNNGGTGQSNLTSLPLPTPVITNPFISGTVSGGATYTSPNLTQPTIADFSNANHNHQSTAGGGTLNAALALQSGSVNYANLLSTIFSGQVSSQVNAGSAGGTMFYINLGGIKMLWGNGSSQSITGATEAVFTWTLPASFFGTLQVIMPGLAATSGNTANSQITSASTTTVSQAITTLGTMSATPSLILIGT